MLTRVMNRLKNWLRRFPRVVRVVNLFRFLREEIWFAAWVWIAPRRFMDDAHRRGSWNFKTAEGQEWHRRVLAAVAMRLGGEQWGDALELGCSEGVFTSYLAGRCRSVRACDISSVACAQAAQRCASYANVRVELLDLAKDDIPGQYDLVFAMDILSCIRGGQRLERAAKKLTNALREGGVLIYTDNSAPLEVLRSWRSPPWWSSLLAMMSPDDCVRFLESPFGLQLVYREQYLPDLPGRRDELLALLQKAPAPAANTATPPSAVEDASGGRPGGLTRSGSELT